MERTGWRFPPERRERLNSEERKQSFPPEWLQRATGLQPGETVLDVGAGTGFWTAPLSDLVGEEGQVFAADVEPIMLDDLRRLVHDRNLQNVQVIQSQENRIPLEAHVADLVLLSFVLHEPSDPLELLSEVVRLLKPSGRVLVLDWHDRPTEAGPPLEQRLSQETTRALLGVAGLVPQSLPSPDGDVYAVLGRELHSGDPEAVTPTA